MALESVNIGTYSNDGTGDDLRSAFRKVNNNFVALAPAIVDGENLGGGIGLFSGVENNIIQFNTISGGDNISLSLVDNVLTISAAGGGIISSLEDDLNLNGHSITGTGTVNIEGSITTTGVIEAGDVQSTVWGIDIGTFDSPFQGGYDFGTLTSPLAGNIDAGAF